MARGMTTGALVRGDGGGPIILTKSREYIQAPHHIRSHRTTALIRTLTCNRPHTAQTGATCVPAHKRAAARTVHLNPISAPQTLPPGTCDARAVTSVFNEGAISVSEAAAAGLAAGAARVDLQPWGNVLWTSVSLRRAWHAGC